MGIEQVGRIANLGRDAAEMAEALGGAPRSVARFLEELPWRAESLANAPRTEVPAGRGAAGSFPVPRFKLYDDGEGLQPGSTAQLVSPNSSEARIWTGTRDAILTLTAGDHFGTGFMISPRFALTADHVISDKAHQLIPGAVARLSDGTTREVRVVGRAPIEDIALVDLADAGNQLPWLRLGSSNALKHDGLLYAAGNLQGTGPLMSIGKHDVTRVEPAEFDGKPHQNIGFLQAYVPGWKGFSGGLFEDKTGRVVAMISKTGLYSSGGPIAQHLRIMADLTKGELPENGWLQVTSEATLHKFPIEWVSVRAIDIAART